jgi:hypothetical protein
MFSCGSKPSSIQSDPDRKNYRCGSESFDNALFIWIGFTGFICFVLLIAFFMTKYKQSPVESSSSSPLSSA